MGKVSPLKAIRFKCLDCSAGNKAEIKNCNIEDCSLYPFRLGKNPNRVGIGNKNAKFNQKIRTQVAVNSNENIKLNTLSEVPENEKSLVEMDKS